MSLPADTATAQLRRSVYWILIAASAGHDARADPGRRFRRHDRGLEKQRLDKAGPAGRARKTLEQQGLSPDAASRSSLKLQSAGVASEGPAPPAVPQRQRPQPLVYRPRAGRDDMRVRGCPYAIDKVIQQPNWDTIDMVKHDGHLYSSKPPLLPTLMAGPYWVIHRLTGATLGTHPYEIGRFMLILVNVVPLAGLLLAPGAAGRAVRHDRLGADVRDGGGRVRHVSDHVRRGDQQPPAGGGLRDDRRVRRGADLVRRRAPLAVLRRWPGCFAALAAANELPALALVGRAGLGPAVEGPAADARRLRAGGARWWRPAFFATNWIAHASLRPPYAHRSTTDRPTTGTTTPTSAAGQEIQSYWTRTGGHRPRASRRGRCTPCTCWWATTASSRSRRSGS